MAEKRRGRTTKDHAYYLKIMRIVNTTGCLSRNANEDVSSPLVLRTIECGTNRVWIDIPPSGSTNIDACGWIGTSGWDGPSRPTRMGFFGARIDTLGIVASGVRVAKHAPIVTLAA